MTKNNKFVLYAGMVLVIVLLIWVITNDGLNGKNIVVNEGAGEVETVVEEPAPDVSFLQVYTDETVVLALNNDGTYFLTDTSGEMTAEPMEGTWVRDEASGAVTLTGADGTEQVWTKGEWESLSYQGLELFLIGNLDERVENLDDSDIEESQLEINVEAE